MEVVFVLTNTATLNETFSRLSTSRRYEAWFLRMGLADGTGAWWFRYLLLNPARGGCTQDPNGRPVQVWATWFPSGGLPQSFIQGFPLSGLDLSAKGRVPFHFQIGENAIDENHCRGALQVEGRSISWQLRYQSTFRVTLSAKGWIGFSRTPHSDALFSGRITLDGRSFEGSPLGYGVQGHNCGYRHRKFWRWGHAYFSRPGAPASTLEGLVYEMPLGLVFRKAVLWHDQRKYVCRNLLELEKDSQAFNWIFRCSEQGMQLDATFDGSGTGVHTLPYMKTDCGGVIQVMNNSLAKARLRVARPGLPVEILETGSGAVLEKGGSPIPVNVP